MKILGKQSLKKILNGAIEISEKTGATIVINGETGSGKTFMINQIAKENNYDILIRVLSNATLEEIIGVPVIFEKNGVKYFDKIIPQWMTPIFDSKNPKPLLLFLDEINRRVIPEQVLFSILDKKIIADKEKRKKIILIACINSGSENYNVQQIEDRAMKNRIILIDFEMEKQDINIMLEEIALTEKEKAVRYLLESFLEHLPQSYGEFPDIYVSLRNWENLFHYLVIKNITTYESIESFFVEDKLLHSIISSQIINDITSIAYHLKKETKKIIEEHLQRKEKLPLSMQINAQFFVIYEIFKAQTDEIKEIAKNIKILFDNATSFSIIKHIMNEVNELPLEKQKEIILQFNKFGLMENINF